MSVFFQEDKEEGEDQHLKKRNPKAEPTFWEQVKLWFSDCNWLCCPSQEENEQQRQSVGAQVEAGQVFLLGFHFMNVCVGEGCLCQQQWNCFWGGEQALTQGTENPRRRFWKDNLVCLRYCLMLRLMFHLQWLIIWCERDPDLFSFLHHRSFFFFFRIRAFILIYEVFSIYANRFSYDSIDSWLMTVDVWCLKMTDGWWLTTDNW